MIAQRRQVLLQAMKLFDLMSMVFCFLLAAGIVSTMEHITFGHFLSMRIKVQNVLVFSVFALIWHFIFSSSGIYSSKRLSSRLSEVVDITKAVSLGTLAFFVMALLFDIRMVNTLYITFFWAANCTITILSRLILQFALKHLRLHGRNLRNIIIIGTNSRALALAKSLEMNRELGYRLIGFVDNGWSKLREYQMTDHVVVSDLKKFPSFLRDNIVDEVMICLPVKAFYREISQIISFCEKQGILVRLLSDIFNLKLAHSRPTLLDGQSLMTFYTGNMEGNPIFIKRLFDFVVALVLIILFSPILLITALAIKLTSPGPIFFVQRRLGLNKRRFGVYKFRTMVPDAENKQNELEALNEMGGAAFKIKNDPRIIPIGKFLRKASIDELPQLFNVLKGDMSLVGPRPLPVRDFEHFDTDWHRRRFSVRPGITCIWQISGRSNISFDKWMELDMEYIDNWSLWLDLKILLRTIPAVLKGSGAA